MRRRVGSVQWSTRRVLHAVRTGMPLNPTPSDFQVLLRRELGVFHVTQVILRTSLIPRDLATNLAKLTSLFTSYLWRLVK